MSGKGPRRSGRNQAVQEEEVEDTTPVDSFHSEVSEVAAGRDQEEGEGEAGGGQPAPEPVAGGDLVGWLLEKLARGEVVSEVELWLADLAERRQARDQQAVEAARAQANQDLLLVAVWEELAENRRESVELWRRLHVVENVGVEEAATAAEADAREYVPYAKTNPWGKEIEGEDEPTLVIGDGYGDRAWDACESRAKAGQWRAQFEELWWGYTINHALFNISALCETAFPSRYPRHHCHRQSRHPTLAATHRVVQSALGGAHAPSYA